MSGLRIADDLELPDEAVTETFAILAVSSSELPIASHWPTPARRHTTSDILPARRGGGLVRRRWGLRASADGTAGGVRAANILFSGGRS